MAVSTSMLAADALRQVQIPVSLCTRCVFRTDIKHATAGHSGTRSRTMMSWRLPKRSKAPDVPGPHIDPCFQLALSKRLGSVASLVEDGARVLDIGTDHAYLPIALLQAGRASKVIACDKNELPLENARKNFETLEGEIRERLELRLGDGLRVLEHGEVDTITTSGIGGKFIAEILFGENFLQADEDEDGPKQNKHDDEDKTQTHPNLQELGVRRLILQPTSYIEGLRIALAANGWSVERETVFTEGRFLYITLLAIPTAELSAAPHSKEDLFLGPVLRRLPLDSAERQPYAIWLRHQLSHYISRRNGLRLMLQGSKDSGASKDTGSEEGGGAGTPPVALLEGEQPVEFAELRQERESEERQREREREELERNLENAEWQVGLLESELALSIAGEEGACTP